MATGLTLYPSYKTNALGGFSATAAIIIVNMTYFIITFFFIHFRADI